MASNIGNVGEFDCAIETFDTYLERVEEFFAANHVGVPTENTAAANGIANRHKLAAFNSLIGRSTYTVLKDLCKPDKPSTKTF